MLAISVSSAMREMGIRIPEDVQIIGVDDIPLSEWTHPKLSTVHIPIEEIVEDGCDALIKMINGDKVDTRKKLYKPWLVHRETTSSMALSR